MIGTEEARQPPAAEALIKGAQFRVRRSPCTVEACLPDSQSP